MIDIENYHKIWRKRAENVPKAVRKTRLGTAKYVIALIRSKAPRKRGILLGGSSRRGTKIEVKATGPNGFPYVKWINGNIDTITLRRRINGWAFLPADTNEPHTKIYAKYGLTPSNWNWTGKRAFVSTSVEQGRKYHKKLMMRELRKSLEVSV